MNFMMKVLYLTVIVGSIAAANIPEDSILEASISADTKTQSKRATEYNRQENHNLNIGTSASPTLTNLPQFYGGNFAQLGHLFASAAAPQIYYVKAPQSNHAGVQYASANALKIGYAPPPQPQHSVAYATAPTNAKVAIAPQPLYQPFQLTYAHQPLSYSPAAISVPYNHQQQIIPIAHSNGYQFAAVPHQQVPIAQQYSYVTSVPNASGKMGSISPNAAHTNNAYHQQQTFAFPAYQHVAAPINIPASQKFVAFPSYSPAQYKTINGPNQPSATSATHATGDGATSFATFSQQLNHHHHSTPTSVTPVKVLAQPQQYYVTVSPSPSTPSPVGYSPQKIAFQPITAASSSPQAYESPHNINGAIHYGTHLYHPTLAKYAYGQVAPSQKLIYSH